MIKKIMICVVFICNGLSIVAQDDVQKEKAGLLVKIGINSFHLGYTFQPNKDICIPVTVGISSNFTEKRYNDFSVEVWPNYKLKRGRLQFPLGIIVGGKYVTNFGNTYPLIYYGLYTGISYNLGKHHIGLNIGFKSGTHKYIIQRNEPYAIISAYETYREFPLILNVSYSIIIKNK